MCDNAHMNETNTPTVLEDVRTVVKRTLEKYLAEGITRIVVDATHPGAKVPLKYKSNPALHLNLSFKYEGHKMAFDQDALRVSLTFEGAEFRVVLPYDCFLAASPFVKEAEPEKPKRPSFLKVVK